MTFHLPTSNRSGVKLWQVDTWSPNSQRVSRWRHTGGNTGSRGEGLYSRENKSGICVHWCLALERKVGTWKFCHRRRAEQQNEHTTDYKKHIEEVVTEIKDRFATPEKTPSARETAFKKRSCAWQVMRCVPIQKTAERKKAAKQEKPKSKETKRTLGESNEEEVPVRKKAKVACESDEEMSFKISKINELMIWRTSEYLTCPTCRHFNLCLLCQKTTKLLADHSVKSEK